MAEIARKVAGEYVKIDALAWKKEQQESAIIVVFEVFTVSLVWGWC